MVRVPNDKDRDVSRKKHHGPFLFHVRDRVPEKRDAERGRKVIGLPKDLRTRMIADPADFYPSPSVFVYTLPNIVTGEIAIRNKYHGESNFILLPEKSEEAMNQAIERAFLDAETTSVLTGWVEAVSEMEFEAEMELVVSS